MGLSLDDLLPPSRTGRTGRLDLTGVWGGTYAILAGSALCGLAVTAGLWWWVLAGLAVVGAGLTLP